MRVKMTANATLGEGQQSRCVGDDWGHSDSRRLTSLRFSCGRLAGWRAALEPYLERETPGSAEEPSAPGGSAAASLDHASNVAKSRSLNRASGCSVR